MHRKYSIELGAFALLVKCDRQQDHRTQPSTCRTFTSLGYERRLHVRWGYEAQKVQDGGPHIRKAWLLHTGGELGAFGEAWPTNDDRHLHMSALELPILAAK